MARKQAKKKTAKKKATKKVAKKKVNAPKSNTSITQAKALAGDGGMKEVLVEYKGLNLHNVKKMHKGVLIRKTLYPGLNKVPKCILEHPMVKVLLQGGQLVEAGSGKKPSSEVIAMINETFELSTLEDIAKSDSRPEVIQAAKKQIEAAKKSLEELGKDDNGDEGSEG